MEQLALCQRWRERRERYRPAGERIIPSRFGVDVVSDRTATAFIAAHHYATSSPPQILSVGLFEAHGVRGPRLVGVCRFSVPMSQRAIPSRTGQEAGSGCELGRLVLLDEVAGNGESFFVSRAFRLLASEKPHIRTVLSYSDPVPRYRRDGTLWKPGHIGCVYQALNARFVGRSAARTLLMTDEGTVVSERALSKIRNDERGARYAYEQLRQLGAPARGALETGREYVERVTALDLFRRLRHPGNLAYTWALGSRSTRRLVERSMPPALPYPKAA